MPYAGAYLLGGSKPVFLFFVLVPTFLLTGSPLMKSDISKAPVPNIKMPSLS